MNHRVTRLQRPQADINIARFMFPFFFNLIESLLIVFSYIHFILLDLDFLSTLLTGIMSGLCSQLIG